MLREVLIARHGQTFGNVQRIVEGHQDFGGLTPLGREQAHYLGQALQHEGVELIISGDLERQLQTAHIISQYVQRDVIPTRMLKERSAGIYEGQPYTASRIENPEIARALYRTFDPARKEESLLSVVDRTTTLRDNLSHFSEKKILLVGSSWINSYVLNVFLDAGKQAEDFFVLRPQENASFHRLLLDYRFRVLDYELNVSVQPTFSSLDRSTEKVLKPAPLQYAYGAQR